MKNKSLVFFIILLFSIFMPSFFVHAESYNINNYDDLISTINNNDTNKVITLSSDIDVTKENGMTIKNGQEVTLELNGHMLSLTVTNASTTYLFYNNGTLTIKDNTDTKKDGTGSGKILFKAENPDLNEMPGYASNTISNYGNLYIESGIIGNDTTGGGAAYGIDTYTNNTKLIINGGKIYSTVAYGIRQYIDRTSSNYVEINGGHIVGYNGFHLFVTNGTSKATTKITGGTFEGENMALCINDYLNSPNNVKVDITGGIFKSKNNSLYVYSRYSEVNITGGNYISEEKYGAYIYSATKDITVSGGTFKGKTYGAYYYLMCPNASIVGGTYTGETGGAYIYGKNSNINIEGATFNSDGTYGAYIYQYSSDVNIDNSTFEANKYGSYIYSYYGNTTIDSGTFDGTDYGIYYYSKYSDDKLLTINDGELKGTYALYYYGAKGTDKRVILNDGLYDGYIFFYEVYNQSNPNSLINSIEINDGRYSEDICFLYYNGTDWNVGTSGNFINGGYYKYSGNDSYWGYYINDGLITTGKLQTAPEGFKYSVGYKITLNFNYYNKEKEIIYSLSDGKLSELYTPKREKYNFIEWNTKEDGTGKTITKDSIIKEEKTLYAIWKIKP